ncbi:MAG TPA: hypothetical protein VK612_03120 [Pyrinomonadaceae bacterium]|nr:hypothetical protein [Pyrinomonadaceae bacterium]
MTDIKAIAHRDASEIKRLSDLAERFIEELNGPQDQFELEEAELSEDGKKWLLTISYLQTINKPNQLQKALGLSAHRVYKRISINKKELKVVGMSEWPRRVQSPV